MAFMDLIAEHFEAFVVDTVQGDEIVPAELINHFGFKAGDEGNNEDIINQLVDYTSAEPISYKFVEGWFAHYSANGFMDQTPWMGPYETKKESLAECRELYGEDEDGSTEEETEQDERNDVSEFDLEDAYSDLDADLADIDDSALPEELTFDEGPCSDEEYNPDADLDERDYDDA